MPEMSRAREDHRDPGRVGGGDHFGVAQRAAGLDHGGRARLDRRDEPVGEGEERVGGYDRADGRRRPLSGRVLRLLRRDARGIDARHLARADANGGAVLGVDDRVGLTYLQTRQANSRSANSVAVGARRVTTLSAAGSSTPLSRSCTSSPPATERTVSDGARGSGRAPAISSRRFFFAARIASASSSTSGAMITSVSISTIFHAVSASSRRLSATIPPNAEIGSQASAFS